MAGYSCDSVQPLKIDFRRHRGRLSQRILILLCFFCISYNYGLLTSHPFWPAKSNWGGGGGGGGVRGAHPEKTKKKTVATPKSVNWHWFFLVF